MAATENHNSVITLATFLKTLDAEVDAYLEGKQPDFDFQWEAFNRQREKSRKISRLLLCMALFFLQRFWDLRVLTPWSVVFF